jgi:hypothetical protein
VVSLCSLVVSLSTAGIFAALIILFHASIQPRVGRAFRLSIFVVTAFLFWFAGFYALLRFSDGEDSSLLARFASNSVILQQHLGIGFVEPIVGTLDLGVIHYLYLYFGIFSLPIVVYFFYLFLRLRGYRLPILLMLVSKISLTAPLFWILLAAIGSQKRSLVSVA